MKSRFRSNAVTKEESEDSLLRAMLYEPFPGNAAVVLSQLGFLGNGQADGLGVRTFDAASGRLSLTMDDGRVVELERATHPRIDNRYAVSVQSREGVVVDRGFILIDRDSAGKDLGVTDLLNNRMAYAEAEGGDHETQNFPEDEAEGVAVAEDEAEGVAVAEDEAEGVAVAEDEVRVEEAAEPEGAVAVDAGGEELVEEAVAEPVVGVEEVMPVVETAQVTEVEVVAEVVEESEPEVEVTVEEAVEGEAVAEGGIGEVGSLAEPKIVVEAVKDVAAEIVVTVEEEPVEVAEVVVEGVADPEPVVAREVSERERLYGPLFAALETNEAVLFAWVAETGTIQTYEHRETGRYLHLDGVSGLFYDQRRTPISKSAALKHAMRPLVVEEAAPVVVVEEPTVVEAAVPVGEELGLDAFVRKADGVNETEPVRESWRSKLSRTLRRSK